MRDLDWEIITVLHETQSITKTAGRFYMSQPSLTRHIQNIEAELGVHILVRNKKGSYFTEAGEVVYKKAVQIVNLQNSLKRDLDMYTSGSGGTLRIGSPRTFTCYRLPQILSVFTSTYPNISIDLLIENSDTLLEKVREGVIDFCFAIGDLTEDDLEKTLIYEDNLYFVYNKPVEYEEISSLQLISFPKNNYLRCQIDAWWNEHFDVPRKIKFKVTSGESCVSMIQQGLGYGFFSDNIYFGGKDNLYSKPLCNKDGTEIKNYTCLVRRKDGAASTAAKHFLDVVKRNFEISHHK